MIGTRVDEYAFNPSAFALAVLCAPALSAAIVLVSVMAAGTLEGPATPVEDLVPALGIGIVLILVCALWGVLPAAVFGALVLFPFERLWRGRSPPRWAFPAAGSLAALIYVVVSLGLAQVMGGGVMVFAPWAGPLDGDTPVRGASLLGGAIVLAGGAAGLIYERFSRVVDRAHAGQQPSDRERVVVRPSRAIGPDAEAAKPARRPRT